jgi:hypothetical protein
MSLLDVFPHKKNRLAVICSYNPTQSLIETVNAVKLFYEEFDIVIIDSDSVNTQIYDLLPKDCIVEYCKNKNYELGAWRYALAKYNDYNVYMFIQDTLTPNCRIPNFDKTNYTNGTIYSCHYCAYLHDGGYFNELCTVYNNSDLHFISQLDPYMIITGAAHSSFIINKDDVNYILQLENAYVDKKLVKSKIDAWLSERTCGIMADKFTRINMIDYFTKISAHRM